MNPPPPEKKSTAKSKTEVEPSDEVMRGIAVPTAAPTPPTGYTQTRTLTIAVWTAAGKAPMYYVTEGAYNAFHGGAENVGVDLRNRLSPPPATAGSG
jgi:hypothetical protein